MPKVFWKTFPGFLNCWQAFKSTSFLSITSLKLSVRVKTVLDSIKILKRYCKGNLNVLAKNKILNNTKKLIYTIGFSYIIKIASLYL